MITIFLCVWETSKKLLFLIDYIFSVVYQRKLFRLRAIEGQPYKVIWGMIYFRFRTIEGRNPGLKGKKKGIF